MSRQVENKRLTSTEEPRLGVYICHCGGNISDVVDVQRVADEVAKLSQVVIARTDIFMCSDSGQELILEDIRKEGVNRVVVASCSPQLHEFTFRNALIRAGLNPYLYEHANIREQVSWVTHYAPEAATEKTMKLVSAAVAKAMRLRPLEPIRVDAKRHAVVIGGGVSGLKSALDLSRRGIGVTLVEKTPFLGGHMAQLGSVFPTGEKARDLLSKLVDDVVSASNIAIYVNAEVIEITGHIGDFHLKVQELPRGVTRELTELVEAIAACPEKVRNEFDYGINNRKAIYQPYEGCYPSLPAIDWQSCTRCGKCAEASGGKGINLNNIESLIHEVHSGVIVMATGFDHYEPHRGEYGFGEIPEVITLPQLIRLIDLNGSSSNSLEWNGKQINNIAMLHCVGSRQIEGIHEPGKDNNINEYCSRVCCTATLQTVKEIREHFPQINVFNYYRDIRTYGRGHESYYEDTSDNLFFRYVPESPPVVEISSNGIGHPLVIRVIDQLTYNEEVEVPVDLVVLSVGMVPQKIDALIDMLKLPVGTDRYLSEVHPKLRPVEVAVNGIFLAGTCQGPKDISESCEAASAASARASAVLSRDYIELDPFVGVVDIEKCNGCGLCVNECHYSGAIYMEGVEVNGKIIQRATISPTNCRGCGACVAVCDPRAICIEGWALDQFEAMVEALVAD